DTEVTHPSTHIAYHKDALNVFVWNRNKPMSDVPEMGIGSQPIDNGNYLFTPEEKDDFLALEPAAEQFFHRWYGAREFLQGIQRWVIWLGDATPAKLQAMPHALERVQAVREYRRQSKRKQTQKAAERHKHFGTEKIDKGNSILYPNV